METLICNIKLKQHKGLDTCSDGSDQGQKKQLQGVIPRPDHQHHPERFPPYKTGVQFCGLKSSRKTSDEQESYSNVFLKSSGVHTQLLCALHTSPNVSD